MGACSPECVRRFAFEHRPSADNHELRDDVLDTIFVNAQRIVAQADEVGELAGFERTAVALVAGQVGAPEGRRAQRILTADLLAWRNRAAGRAILAGNALPDRIEHRG